ncbi:MAG: hypothetical protein ABIL39_11690 [candidate division WOR-3 bacterium]
MERCDLSHKEMVMQAIERIKIAKRIKKAKKIIFGETVQRSTMYFRNL